jgi:uncharacterized membrane protein (DUF106 family)
MIIYIYQEAVNILDLLLYPLGSTFFIMLLSLTISLITSFLTTKLVDTKEIQRKQLLIKKHKDEKAKIIQLAEKNPKQYKKKVIKWKRKDQFIKKIEQGMTFSKMKPQCITLLPMFILFLILNAFFQRNPIACPPMNANDIPLLGEYLWAATDINLPPPAWTALVWGEARHVAAIEGWIGFTAWYFLTSFFFNTIIQRLIGIQTQAMGGMESMFKGAGAQAMEFPEV